MNATRKLTNPADSLPKPVLRPPGASPRGAAGATAAPKPAAVPGAGAVGGEVRQRDICLPPATRDWLIDQPYHTSDFVSHAVQEFGAEVAAGRHLRSNETGRIKVRIRWSSADDQRLVVIAAGLGWSVSATAAVILRLAAAD